MAKSILNGNVGVVARFIKEVGLPTALLFALGWVAVNYWIAPQSRLLEVLTISTDKMAESYSVMSKTIEQNTEQITQTNKMMDDAYEIMEEVPAQRQKEIEISMEVRDQLIKSSEQEVFLLQEIKDNIIGQVQRDELQLFHDRVDAHHEKSAEERKEIIDKLKQP